MVNSQIRILPPHIVNRIAAGEVVERPASVVKELVENAIDAGASRIDIMATDGGRHIRVADNGNGMTPENAQLAFFNHATSKIQDETDLERIITLGFRGEALASIAAISKVVCYTRPETSDTGCKITLDNEGNPSVTEAGCSPGTVIELEDLFYNTPARLKFLKKPGTELGHIEQLVQHLALSHPDVQINLSFSDKPILKTTGSGSAEQAMVEVYKLSDQIQHFIPISYEDADAGYHLTGMAGPPDMQKSSRRWLITMVNGRSVKCPTLNKAIETAFDSLIPHGKFPFCVIYLSIPTDELDVNVHPTKKEVRYANPNSIFSFVKTGILTALQARGHHAYSYESAPSSNRQYSQPILPRPTRTEPVNESVMDLYKPVAPDAPLPSMNQPSLFSPDSPSSENQDPPQTGKPLKVIGQLFYTYILIESPQGLMVVDQHIASERTFFEALSQNIYNQEPDSQQLVTSTPIRPTPVQLSLLASHQEKFCQLGFQYTLNDDLVTLTSVPLIYLDKQKPDKLFESLVSQLEETGEMSLDLDLMIATMACHSAVRAGDVLDHHEMKVIIDRWLDCKLPWTCPHGRPIAHTISTNQLNQFFHRPSLPINA